MLTKSGTIRAMAAIAVLASLTVWAQPSSAAICGGATVDECGNVRCPPSNDVVFTVLNLQDDAGERRWQPDDIDNPGPKFDQRSRRPSSTGRARRCPKAGRLRQSLTSARSTS
jgi:hypothetical protein